MLLMIGVPLQFNERISTNPFLFNLSASLVGSPYMCTHRMPPLHSAPRSSVHIQFCTSSYSGFVSPYIASLSFNTASMSFCRQTSHTLHALNVCNKMRNFTLQACLSAVKPHTHTHIHTCTLHAPLKIKMRNLPPPRTPIPYFILPLPTSVAVLRLMGRAAAADAASCS